MEDVSKHVPGMLIPIIVIAAAFIGMLFFVAHRLIYPAPPASRPWGRWSCNGLT